HYADKHLGVDLRTDKKYLALRDKALAKMRKRMVSYWARVHAAIEEVRVYAHEKGVAMGFENRERFEELPMDPDFTELIESIQKPHTAGYWHDTGHAHIKESLALLDHKQHLEMNAATLLGFHLHDVSAEGQDHQPIGSGKIDFEMVSSFWKPNHILVLEFSPRLSKEDVLASKAKVDALIAKRFGAG
ncbi:MAG TPA: TIM barrel protein, partial [Opitutaceae bacterium]